MSVGMCAGMCACVPVALVPCRLRHRLRRPRPPARRQGTSTDPTRCPAGAYLPDSIFSGSAASRPQTASPLAFGFWFLFFFVSEAKASGSPRLLDRRLLRENRRRHFEPSVRGSLLHVVFDQEPLPNRGSGAVADSNNQLCCRAYLFFLCFFSGLA